VEFVDVSMVASPSQPIDPSQNLDPRDLVPGTVVVSSGVGHLVARQGEGWAYLRP
jgi:hypothetical protein